jgi:hypothetical protein
MELLYKPQLPELDMDKKSALSENVDLKKFVGKNITVIGKCSSIPWQHLMAPSKEFPIENYFDLYNQEQIVVYSKQKLPENVSVKITGIVFEVRGGSKNPNELTKIDDSFVEYHINAEKWNRIKS